MTIGKLIATAHQKVMESVMESVMAANFIQVQFVFLTAAMPPDVRKACGLPAAATPTTRGYAPKRGRSRKSLRRISRQVRDLPHIGRHSRKSPAVNFTA